MLALAIEIKCLCFDSNRSLQYCYVSSMEFMFNQLKITHKRRREINIQFFFFVKIALKAVNDATENLRYAKWTWFYKHSLSFGVKRCWRLQFERTVIVNSMYALKGLIFAIVSNHHYTHWLVFCSVEENNGTFIFVC